MKQITVIVALVLAELAAWTPCGAQTFDPRDYQDRIDDELTQIMVLGTAHLSGTPDDWDPDVLAPLLNRLAEFRPDVIATEDQPGPTLTKLWAYREVHPEVAATYGGRALRMATIAGLELDMDMPQAAAAAKEQLLAWPADPSSVDRRRLAATFAASGDPNSGLVQWLRLEKEERVPGDGVSPALADELNGLAASRNETVTIAAQLAVRLGHERLYPTDSQEEDVFTPAEAALFYAEVFPELVRRLEADALLAKRGKPERMTDPASTLAEYRLLNDAAINERSSEGEWLGVMDRPTQDDVGRKRVAAWEARNMRMAANIREASARAPGGRVLVVIGAAHKVWLEAYLGMMSDVAIVSTDEVLY